MICITYTSYTRGINLIKSFKDMPLLTLLPVEDYDLPKLETWLKKEHVLRWYHDVDEWMNEIRERNGEFAFLNHYVAYWDNIPVGFGQWYDCFDAKEEWYQVEKPDEMFSIDYFIGVREINYPGISSKDKTTSTSCSDCSTAGIG